MKDYYEDVDEQQKEENKRLEDDIRLNQLEPQPPAYLDESCWHVGSKVMRYMHDRDAYEAVCMRELSVGDEVLVRNPELKTLDHEKIIRIHHHGKEKHDQSSKVRATKLTI